MGKETLHLAVLRSAGSYIYHRLECRYIKMIRKNALISTHISPFGERG